MHEEALLRDLRGKIEEIAREQDARRIGRIAIWIGALSHVTEAHLRSEWPRVVDGTVAQDARLDVEVSRDPYDARAQGVVLARVTLE